MQTDLRYDRAIFRGLVLVRCPVLSALSLQLVLAAGCAAIEGPGSTPAAEGIAQAQAASVAARASAIQMQSGHEPQYLRLKAEETQLAGAHDDGRITYLEFSAPVTGPLALFDHEGRPLSAAIAARVVAVEGVHAGILVRRADSSSFISPNPRALSLPQRAVPRSADHLEARAKLENRSDQLQAMQKALAAASRQAEPRLAAARPAEPPASWIAPSPAALPLPVSPRAHPYPMDEGRMPLSRHLPLPSGSLRNDRLPAAAGSLAVANWSASAPEEGLVRIFFATASRAIVAPDDGLSLLLRETANADQIRVTGYTDATGSRATNDALALARAEAVVQILLRRGVPPSRIFRSAVGAEDFIADNASDRGRARNRRVEVLLMKNGAPLMLGAPAGASR